VRAPIGLQRGADREALRGAGRLDPAAYSGHSLRAGFLTSAAEAGASVFKMMGSPGTSPSTCCAATSGGRICSKSTPGRRSCDQTIKLRDHAVRRLVERNIRRAWVEATVATPDWTAPDPNPPSVTRAFRAMPDAQGYILRGRAPAGWHRYVPA
jgi:hypothetical protein